MAEAEKQGQGHKPPRLTIEISRYHYDGLIAEIRAMAKRDEGKELSDRAAKRYLADCIRNNVQADAEQPSMVVGDIYID